MYQEFFEGLFYTPILELYEASKKSNLRPITYSDAIQSTIELQSNSSNPILSKFDKILTLKEYACNFMESIEELSMVNFESKFHIDYRKKSILRFLDSIINLRIYNFIESPETSVFYLPFYKMQEEILKIRPSLSSSNSIIAGMLASETIKYLLLG